MAKRRPDIPQSEQLAGFLAKDISRHIVTHNGRYLRDEDGSLHLIIDGKRVPLNLVPDNHELNRLFLTVCNVSTVTSAARAAIQRLQVEAIEKAHHSRLRRFSAVSDDGSRLYVPLEGGELFCVSADRFDWVHNGENEDRLWVEHPCESPLNLTDDETLTALSHFERLLVETQSCVTPAMRWFVGMNAGFFPYIREQCPARFIQVSVGPSQSGKTSGAERFTLLHGLGSVKGDYTVAALGNAVDVGLLVLDNKEQANFTQELVDYCLFLATGAERGRSHQDGRMRRSQAGRPVAIITSIEGVVRPELQERCPEIQYCVTGDRIPRGSLEREIQKLRHAMGTGMMCVLRRYFEICQESRPTPNPLPNFEEHFIALCNLLRAFGDVANKPQHWAEEIIEKWNTTLVGREADDNDLEHPLLRVLDENGNSFVRHKFKHGGVEGRLYVTEAGHLLTMLQKLNLRDLSLPRTAQGLSRRLNSSRFRSIVFLRTDTPEVPVLKRTGTKRPIGVFRHNDA